MCHVAMRASGFPRERVLGMAGVLDSARFRTFIAHGAGRVGRGRPRVRPRRPRRHDGAAVALLDRGRACRSRSSCPRTGCKALEDRTANGGAEIVALLKTGSAFYAPAASTFEMVDAILRDRKRVLPCAVQLKGEFGVDGLFVGVPVVLGRGGLERVFEITLTADERVAFDESAAAVRELVDKLPA